MNPQASCVVQHAILALDTHPDSPGVIKVQTMAQLLAQGIDGSAITLAIQKTVHDVFEHVIDPKAGGTEVQARLNDVHGRTGSPLVRC